MSTCLTKIILVGVRRSTTIITEFLIALTGPSTCAIIGTTHWLKSHTYYAWAVAFHIITVLDVIGHRGCIF